MPRQDEWARLKNTIVELQNSAADSMHTDVEVDPTAGSAPTPAAPAAAASSTAQ